MVRFPKHCWNLHQGTFGLFICHFNGNFIRKSLSYWHEKSWDSFLTHWLPMKNILFFIGTISRYQLRCKFLINKERFLRFLLHFSNLDSILNIMNKKVTLIGFVFPKIRTLKGWSDKCLKSPVWEHAWTSNMGNMAKHCSNLHHSTFIIFIDHFQGNWVGKSLSYWHGKSWDCLLTHWLPMKSILFLKEIIQGYQLRCNYLRKKTIFLNFLLNFSDLD